MSESIKRNNINDEYIHLYAEDFSFEVWENYCNCLKIPENSIEIKVGVNSVEVIEFMDDDEE